MIIPVFRLNDKHKFIKYLKKYLNQLVEPSPNLSDDDVVDDKTLAAAKAFKIQWIKKVLNYIVAKKEPYAEITPGLWAMIGRALGKDKILKELRDAKDNEVRSLLVGMEEVNALYSYYTPEMERCDAKVAAALGGKNAIASANGFEPDSLVITNRTKDNKNTISYYRGDTTVNGKSVVGYLSAYIMHLYGSTDGTRFGVDSRTKTDIYIPDGFEMTSSANWDGKLKKNALTQIPTPIQAVVTFYYKQLGNVKDTTLLLMHVKDFQPKREGNRWRIGKIGGVGSEIADINFPYLHSHFMSLKGDVGLGWKESKSDVDSVMKYRASIGVRFVDIFC